MKEGGFSKGKLANYLTAYTADNGKLLATRSDFNF